MSNQSDELEEPAIAPDGYGDPRSRPRHVIDEEHSLTEAEVEKVVERIALRAPAVYAVVKEEGEAELARPTASLFWSGIVAGIAMGLSILTLSLLRMHLPNTEWAPLVTSFGYAAGFLVVILGRQQLFTESTITIVLPVIADKTSRALKGLLRVWGTVLLANWIGCALVALGFVTFALVPQEIGAAIIDASRHYGEQSAGTAFVHGIGAGFLVAAMVWMMPGAERHKFALITFTAWLIALGGFTHVIAGMVEVVALVLAGELSFFDGLFTLALPTLAGNVLGGTGLFALLAYAQVKDEVEPSDVR